MDGRRAQAARNDTAILEAARAVYAADPEAPIAAVAARAGVGISALYRRYPSKEELLRKLCGDGLRESIAAAEAALADDGDAWKVFRRYMTRVVEADAHTLSFRLAIALEKDSEALWQDATKAQDLRERVFKRAQKGGAVRADAVPEDSATSSSSCPRSAGRARSARRSCASATSRSSSTACARARRRSSSRARRRACGTARALKRTASRFATADRGKTVCMDIGRTALRLVIGPLFVGHGTQKLFGWFGGHGLDATAGMFEGKLGLKPGKRHATAAGASEAIGGALLTVGALTPVAAGLITGTMITAIRKVHAPNGPWVTQGGYEYNAVLIAAVLALTADGPGRPSVDAAAFPRLKGDALALATFAAAAAASAYLTADRSEPAADEVPGEEQVTAPRQERFAREPADVPAASSN